ncbi:pentapeptide repeat-containing protein [Clostridium algidicarnis]|uniref:Pentapeptide repeat protein n=1 Tax=Clostridium algidicarnis DSM 15099 TaxID=1121295 RepID=A0A2S6FXX3_9CLOT|nr:pentapeptide repeat-containing protein [Clostridium algidicarnis]MBU3204457.1 pentapeptide repeat-containing protein [Clostridium algidicarnis]MBU3212460.1 pentapeptide repeat-containing protein [Clostridium algidicarnis]MBU3222891.1 pentapeptide repeat-containing protein [Clostridium algidicarnis]MCB2286976.1 pentapeptide repeat-containing protein [Clostridium algidicarnis]PPK48278.1 pentapeptide repeat protein [Clostridium algidicarnis DSM 15099]
MARNQSVKGNFNYNNIEKKDKNFMYKNLARSNCYNCNFSNSNFDYVSFRGAHFKSSDFFQCTFRWAEFIGANLKGSSFKDAIFENAIFDSVNLEAVNFKDATFINTVFLSTDVKKAKNLDRSNPNIKIFDEMPDIKISEDLRIATENVMTNAHVKAARIFDTKDGDLNLLNLMILLEYFDEKTLIEGLRRIQLELDRDFHTLSYVIRLLKDSKIDKPL